MWEILGEILADLDAALIAPLTQASIQVAVLALSNLTFYKIVHEYLPQALYFTPLALCFGIFHLCLFSSADLITFSFLTAIFFSAFLHLAILINKLSEYSYDNILKTLVFCYALLCFRFCTDKDDFDEYVVTFIVMTVKLMCASGELEKESWEEKTREHGLLVTTFTMMSYLLYTAWVSYKDFLILRNKQHEKNERWWNIMSSAGSRAILFKVLSHELIYKNIGDFWMKEQIFLIIRAFQCRCKYYYRAQIAELEVIAAGVKKGGWNKHCMFSFERAEFSLTAKDFFTNLNIPLSTYLRLKFTTKNRDGRIEVLLNIALFVFLLMTYNVYVACIWFWFLFSVYSQVCLLFNVVEVCDICLFSCSTKFCYHKYGRRWFIFYVAKFILIGFNHFRLSLLFIHLSVPLEMSFRCTIASVIIDCIFVAFFLIIRKPKHEFFSLLNMSQET